MKPTVGVLRLRLNESAEWQLAKALRVSDATIGRVGLRTLAGAIASRTVNALVEDEMLDPGTAPELLRTYAAHLAQERPAHDCILRFSVPDEGKLAVAVKSLNRHARLHVWEMAHRIPPPKSFYKAHPEILEACKMCGTVIIDAGTPATLTIGSMNPFAGDFLAHWIQSALEVDPTETRPRFFFQVVVPARHWEAIVRAHFRIDYGI